MFITIYTKHTHTIALEQQPANHTVAFHFIDVYEITTNTLVSII